MTDNDIVKVRRLRAENDALSKATAALAEFKRRAEARIEKLEAALWKIVQLKQAFSENTKSPIDVTFEMHDAAREALETKR